MNHSIKWIQENNPYFTMNPFKPAIIHTWLSCDTNPNNKPDYIKRLEVRQWTLPRNSNE